MNDLNNVTFVTVPSAEDYTSKINYLLNTIDIMLKRMGYN